MDEQGITKICEDVKLIFDSLEEVRNEGFKLLAVSEILKNADLKDFDITYPFQGGLSSLLHDSFKAIENGVAKVFDAFNKYVNEGDS